MLLYFSVVLGERNTKDKRDIGDKETVRIFFECFFKSDLSLKIKKTYTVTGKAMGFDLPATVRLTTKK
ncbi:MAG: hypothetical protein LBJ00_12320 [Planctomycetaceae bacterium]|jgi:hypothetical protein|nr:hypothetical protein [Planctomycetaceae bacterium]